MYQFSKSCFYTIQFSDYHTKISKKSTFQMYNFRHSKISLYFIILSLVTKLNSDLYFIYYFYVNKACALTTIYEKKFVLKLYFFLDNYLNDFAQ